MYASKPANHNSALCAFLTDCQFEAIINNKDKLEILCNRGKQTKSTKSKEIDPQVIYQEIGFEEKSKETEPQVIYQEIEFEEIVYQEIEFKEEEERQIVNLHSIMTSARQPLRCIGQVNLGEDKLPVSCLQDIGSTGTFVTHDCASRTGMKKINTITLTVKSMGTSEGS